MVLGWQQQYLPGLLPPLLLSPIVVRLGAHWLLHSDLNAAQNSFSLEMIGGKLSKLCAKYFDHSLSFPE
jgi:hypothetical protein